MVVRWLGAIGLPQIGRSAPCKLYSGIIFLDRAAMKAWKRLATILETLGGVRKTEIMKQS